MGPRKRSKPNPEAGVGRKDDTLAATASTAEATAAEATADATAESQSVKDVPTSSSLKAIGASLPSQSTPQLASSALSEQKQVDNRASWYGSWRGKPTQPVAEVAKDIAEGTAPSSGPEPSMTSKPKSIRATRKGSAADTNSMPPSPRRYMSGSTRKASKSEALASTSSLNVVSDNSKNVVAQPAPATPTENAPKDTAPEPPLPPDPAPASVKDGTTKPQAQTSSSNNGSWFGWWSRPDGYVEKSSSSDKKEEDKTAKDAQQKPLPESPAEERTQPKLDQTQIAKPPPNPKTSDEPPAGNRKAASILNVGTQRSSWFWLWSSQQNAQAGERPATANGSETPPVQKVAANTELPKDTPMPDAPSTKASEPTPATPAKSALSPDAKVNTKPAQSTTPRKSTGWAFWSREEPDDGAAGKTHKQVGEIAVEGTPSQNHPEAAQFNESQEQEQPSKDAAKAKAKSARDRTAALKDTPKQATTPTKGTPSGSPDRAKANEPKVAALAGKTEQPKQAKETPKKEDKHILLPSFDATYSLLPHPTLWSQIRRLFISDPTTHTGPHLHLTSTPPRIKKALAIGIHGFFPSPIYQKILGPPTGTSIRFANCASHAIKSWADTHGSSDVQIEKIALEGEGLISERVDTLWKLLLNWIEHIRSADFILVACHSQGVPVAVMLVAKLIQFGCISPNMKVGICAMAGINLGPFAEYKTRLFGGVGMELFDFAEPGSRVSEEYRHALELVLANGVKVVYVGSIDDQLVSLESSTFSPLSHPSIYRAVFIDGRLHTSDFLTNLIGFTLKLRNLGLPDHGLIRELSPALAGSLYSGEGHSSLHSWGPIYDLAVRHTLETIPSSEGLAPQPPGAKGASGVVWGQLQGPPSVKDANPYFLPWAMRGILEEEAVRRMMGEEVEELLRLFEEWKPVSKGLKDIKFRLEAVRSKL